MINCVIYFYSNKNNMNLENKTCLITGATSGIGKETALSLAKEGANIVITSRNIEKGDKTKQEIISLTHNNKVEVMYCNLASFESIRLFVDEFKAKHKALHILINNAGIWEYKRKESVDGIELNFAVNHLAPFLMTNLLLDLIKSSAPARIITLSSIAHKMAKLNFADIEGKKSWNTLNSYAQSKLFNILFTKKLSQILRDSMVTANCVHPGVVNTSLFNKMNKTFKLLANPFMLTPKKGAQTTIYLATSPDLKDISGEYFSRKKISNPSKTAKNQKLIGHLWEISKDYTAI